MITPSYSHRLPLVLSDLILVSKMRMKTLAMTMEGLMLVVRVSLRGVMVAMMRGMGVTQQTESHPRVT